MIFHKLRLPSQVKSSQFRRARPPRAHHTVSRDGSAPLGQHEVTQVLSHIGACIGGTMAGTPTENKTITAQAWAQEEEIPHT